MAILSGTIKKFTSRSKTGKIDYHRSIVNYRSHLRWKRNKTRALLSIKFIINRVNKRQLQFCNNQSERLSLLLLYLLID